MPSFIFIMEENMIYKIIVDKQSRKNPSKENLEYNIDIEQLRMKEDLFDTLTIERDIKY